MGFYELFLKNSQISRDIGIQFLVQRSTDLSQLRNDT
jgi:hypothetical protein